MTTIEESVRNYNRIFNDLYTSNGGSLPESSGALNDAARAVIDAYTEKHGTCWLGLINLYDRPALWAHDGSEFVYNFGAEFVLPDYDRELEEMIYARDRAGLKNLIKNTHDVTERIIALGGERLIWS
jgi:hypothetical protein